jgi:glycosyltransferase involved in cell wall biosynthesis
MIKIAFVIDTIATPGAGTEKQLLAVAGGLDRSRFDVRLVCLHQSEWLRTHQLPFPVEILSVHSLLRPSAVRAYLRYVEYLRRHRFDVIHAHYFDSVVLTAKASPFAPKAVYITSRRGFLASEKPQRLKQFALRLVRWRYQGFVCNSRALAADVSAREGLPAGKIRVIYNGVDLERSDTARSAARPELLNRLGIRSGDVLIVATANLRPVKNIELLITAAARLRQNHPQAHFVVVGEGPQRPELERLVDHSRLRDSFHLVGAHTHPEEILAHAHIGVLTSSSESLSNALIEYGAMGLPAVASQVGGNAEIIEDGRTGLLFESGDPAGLVSCLSKLIENADLRQSMGAAARKTVTERFSLARCLQEYEEYYEEMARSRGQHHSPGDKPT